MVCGHGGERIARLPLAAALNNPVASNSARNTRTLSDLGGLSTSTCSHETHRRAFPKLQPRHSHVRRPLVPNGGMTSLRGVGSTSRRPCRPKRQARSGVSGGSGKTSDSKIIFLGYTQLADRGVLVAVVSEKHSRPPAVEIWVRRGR